MKKLIYLIIVLAVVFPACKKAQDKPLKKNKTENIRKTMKSENKNIGKNKQNKKKNIEKMVFFDKKPKFEVISQEPVSLKYKFKTGDKVNIAELLKMTTRYNNRLVYIDTYFYGHYEVKSKEGSDYIIHWVIDRIKIKSKVKANGIDKDYEYDSASGEESKMTDARILKHMLNVVMSAKVNEYGKIKDIDLKDLIKAIEESSLIGKVRGDIIQKAEQFIKTSFILLPEKQVGVNDTYEGRSNMQDSSMLELTSKRSYKITAISGDKKKVLLKPVITFEINKNKTKQKIDIKRKKNEGWILFDIEKGIIEKSYFHSGLSMKINDIDMKLDMKSNFKTFK